MYLPREVATVQPASNSNTTPIEIVANPKEAFVGPNSFEKVRLFVQDTFASGAKEITIRIRNPKFGRMVWE